jgi:hypothetical protein
LVTSLRLIKFFLNVKNTSAAKLIVDKETGFFVVYMVAYKYIDKNNDNNKTGTSLRLIKFFLAVEIKICNYINR